MHCTCVQGKASCPKVIMHTLYSLAQITTPHWTSSKNQGLHAHPLRQTGSPA